MEHDFDPTTAKCKNCRRPREYIEKFELACEEPADQMTGKKKSADKAVRFDIRSKSPG